MCLSIHASILKRGRADGYVSSKPTSLAQFSPQQAGVLVACVVLNPFRAESVRRAIGL